MEEPTERKLEIAAAQLAPEAIVEELARLRELIALAPGGIFLADLDGTVRVQSTPGEGATFVLLLPAEPPG